MSEYIYVIVHRSNGDEAIRYFGMGVQVISDMLAAQDLTGTVVSKEDYDKFVSDLLAANKPK